MTLGAPSLAGILPCHSDRQMSGFLLDLNHVLHVIGQWEGACAFLIRQRLVMCFHGEFFLYFSAEVGFFGHPVFGLVRPG